WRFTIRIIFVIEILVSVTRFQDQSRAHSINRLSRVVGSRGISPTNRKIIAWRGDARIQTRREYADLLNRIPEIRSVDLELLRRRIIESGHAIMAECTLSICPSS